MHIIVRHISAGCSVAIKINVLLLHCPAPVALVQYLTSDSRPIQCARRAPASARIRITLLNAIAVAIIQICVCEGTCRRRLQLALGIIYVGVGLIRTSALVE